MLLYVVRDVLQVHFMIYVTNVTKCQLNSAIAKQIH